MNRQYPVPFLRQLLWWEQVIPSTPSGTVTCLVQYEHGFLFAGEVCGAGWTAGLQDTCFKIVPTRSTWDAAMGTCKDLGGSLATLDTQARNAFIIGNLAMITGTCDVWLSVGNLNLTSAQRGLPDWLNLVRVFWNSNWLSIQFNWVAFLQKKGEGQPSDEWN